MKRTIQGFTLIELMIVIAIIGVLASIAIPQYQDYVTRAKVSEGLNLAEQAKTAVGVSFQALGYMPTANNSSYDLPTPTSISGTYVESVTMGANGVISIEYNGNVGYGVTAGQILTLTPITSPEGGITWVCGNTTVTAYGRTVHPTTTTVDGKFLPTSCRG